MRKQEIHRLKISMCRSCGLWCQCQVGFKKWLDQEHCRFAAKHDRRDQCRYTGESGDCSNLEAQTDANYGRRKGDIL